MPTGRIPFSSEVGEVCVMESHLIWALLVGAN